MATPEELDVLRLYVAELNDESGWDDTRLQEFLVKNGGNMQAAAADIWSVKASEYAALVDVSESGSSRKLGDLFKNATSMAGYYASLSGGGGGVGTTDGPTITRIRRTIA